MFLVSVCDGATCYNGGQCVPLNTTMYECSCTSAYSGPQCDGKDIESVIIDGVIKWVFHWISYSVM